MGPELILNAIGGTLWLASFGLLHRLATTTSQEERDNQEGNGLPARSTNQERHRPHPSPPHLHSSLSLIIPARNEAHNLPRLLDSIRTQAKQPLEVLVIDDASTDATAEIASAHGATVITSQPLPDGWRGKPWACHQGALAAKGSHLLFLDADCWFEPGGLDRLLHHYHGGAFSVAPYHRVQKPYEELSAFFNLIMVASTTGHGLFGQTLLIDRASYDATGGHLEVKGRVLENLRLAAFHRAGGVPVTSLPGRGMISFRMYPEGLATLIEGWTKGFASGAAETPRSSIFLVALWISGLMVALFALPWAPLLYPAFALQFAVMLRKVGSFSLLTASIYPLPLLFYFTVFARSLLRSGKTVTWKGREFRAD
ncbi:MAG: glycosyltransferase [Verrucomicrobia bacterium]|nr:MAG: glycosyltransferase [Verrucomicrobiota bacterium]TAE88855.1 MAG: glycosyltransferase [Verrucomicrobiota bacterium]TAF27272.1 MAG: glycosyltransferase [Verrucomicrobiota bacterium]TAF42437.1 MAG: glycosyltransferase [Verrucomicrobiota bacterium]